MDALDRQQHRARVARGRRDAREHRENDDLTTYIVNSDDIPALREVWLERYRNLPAPPANTLLVVSRLAEPGMLIEIDVVAAVPAS